MKNSPRYTWIVGAGAGLGQSYAHAFENPVLISRSAQPPFNLDVANLDAQKLAALIVQYPPEVLIYNAFVPRRAGPMEVGAEDLIYDFKVHCVGLVGILQACESALHDAPKPAVLISGGGFAHDPSPELFSLGLGKALQLNLAKSLSKHWKDTAIRTTYLTINGRIDKDTGIDPDNIARAARHWYDSGDMSFEVEIAGNTGLSKGGANSRSRTMSSKPGKGPETG